MSDLVSLFSLHQQHMSAGRLAWFLLSSLILVGGLSGCGPEKKLPHPAVSSVFPSKETDIRMVDLMIPADSVSSIESGTLLHDDLLGLEYADTLPGEITARIGYYTGIAEAERKAGLVRSIVVNLSGQNPEELSGLYADLVTELSSRYGPGEGVAENYKWSQAVKQGSMEISCILHQPESRITLNFSIIEKRDVSAG